VNINSERLKAVMERAGATPESLGASIARRGLNERDAVRAVRNWMVGRGHPRPKPEDIRAIGEALGAPLSEFVRFVSRSRWVRSSPRKARLAADLIRGKRVDEAKTLLTFSDRRASEMLLKTLETAIADAEQEESDVSSLVVAESRVDAGVTIKRFQPKDRGRAHQILKRTSHLTIGVEEQA